MRNCEIFKIVFQKYLTLDISDASLLAILVKKNIGTLFYYFYTSRQSISGKSQYFMQTTNIRVYKHISSTIPWGDTEPSPQNSILANS